MLLYIYLVDNACTRSPKARPVFGGDSFEEFVYFIIFVQRVFEISVSRHPRLNQVITVNGGRNRHFVSSGLHKLEHGGLPQYILENDPVGAYLKIAFSSDHLLILRVVQVGEQYFISKGQRAIQFLSDNPKIL